MDRYVLHYAPDNASLCVRLALEVAGIPYSAVLVDRRARAHKAPSYLTMNPNGLIPVLETPEGPLFETGAILLWLADRHEGLAPPPGHPDRGRVLTWLFWMANSLHATERTLFYPTEFCPGAPAAMTAAACDRVLALLAILDQAAPTITTWMGAAQPSILDCYLGPLLRWPALYAPGAATGWYDAAWFPALQAAMIRFEGHSAVKAAARAEGLGPWPFTQPRLPCPPEGSVL